MLEISPRSRTERKLTNRSDQEAKLFNSNAIDDSLSETPSKWDLGSISSIVDTRFYDREIRERHIKR